jgi:hypothetical protein
MAEVKIKMENFDNFDVDEFLQWSDEIIGKDNWSYTCRIFTFVNEADAILFKLRYGL